MKIENRSAFIAVVLLAGCRSELNLQGPGSEAPPSEWGRIQGVLRGLSGEALAGATVAAGGVEGTTDQGGFFYLNDVPVGEKIPIYASLPGYSSASTRRTIRPEVWTYAELYMMPASQVAWSPSVDGFTLSTEDVSVSFPAGVETEDGVPEEPITVTWSFLGRQNEILAAPGDMMAQGDDGYEARLESFGMAELRLEDAAGLEVQPVDGAVLSFPLAATADFTEGEEAPLFGFDEARGLWTRQGSGIVENGRFVAEVPHFSWWNCDRYLNTDACVTGQLVIDGVGVANASLRVEEAETLTTGVFETDEQGYFQIEVPKGELFSLELAYGPSTWASGEQVATEDAQDGCLNLGEMAAVTADADQDGYVSAATGGPDCDDQDDWIHPGVEEVWYNGVDEDCDGNDADKDGDEYAWDLYEHEIPAGMGAGDCDDEDRSRNPGHTEWCDEVDSDCDDLDDSADPDLVDGTAVYPDLDGDGYGDEDAAVSITCDRVIDDGYSEDNTDCDDDDGAVNPGAPEACDDTADWNCDGVIVTESDCTDTDGDGSYDTIDCAPDDPAVYPGADEICDGVNNDCDDETDEDVEDPIYGALPWFPDFDGDGYGEEGAEAVWGCTGSAWYVTEATDCDDLDDRINPDAVDNQCDGLADDDCDRVVDDDAFWVGPDGMAGGYDYDNLQEAITDAEDGGVICVEAGTYDGVADWIGKDLTVLGVDGVDATILDGLGDGPVMYMSGLSPLSSFEGFTVTGGDSTYGGGLYLVNSSPSLANLTVSNSSASSGGGIYLSRSSPTMSDVVVSGSSATYGGGMYLSLSYPDIENLTLSDDSADVGGGLYVSNSIPSLTSVSVSGCSASQYGGGLYLYNSSATISNGTVSGNSAEMYGGGVYLYDSSPTLSQVTVSGNSSGRDGGGLWLYSSSPSLQMVTVSGNTAMWGAGLYLTESSPSLVDVTISRNTATTEGGAAWLWRSDISMTNTIIAENSAAANGGLVRYWGDSGASTLTATYSDIWGNSPADTDSFGFTAGVSGNIAADPAFVSTSDFHLRSSSRLIGAGSPLLIDPDGSISDIGALGPDGSGW